MYPEICIFINLKLSIIHHNFKVPLISVIFYSSIAMLFTLGLLLEIIADWSAHSLDD